MSLLQSSSPYDNLEALRSTPLPGEEFPYANSGLGGLKCCSKCGATKTPQWREGPCGPKTLCNACGVKRTRTLRALQEGAKRARTSGSGSSRGTKAEPPSSSSLEASSGGGSPLPLFVGGGRRPQRRAAEEAAVRTARYARTGEWCEAQPGYAVVSDRRGAVYHVRAGTDGDVFTGSPSSSQDTALGAGGDMLLGVEEIALTPLAAEAAARHGVAAMDSACFAAVNLMTMAVKEAGIGARRGPLGASSPLPRQRTAPATPEDSPARRPSPLGAETPLGQTGLPALTGVDLPGLYKTLPPGQVMELINLNAELEHALAAARDAGQSVGALAQLLAEKQAASLAARQAARAASRRMHRFLAVLEVQQQQQQCHQ